MLLISAMWMGELSRLAFGYDEEVRDWVIERVPHLTEIGHCTSIGIVSGDRLIAGVLYHDYQPHFRNIQLSMAADSPMWARPGNIAALLHYPFEQLKVWMLYTVTPESNERALKVNKHIGIKRKTVLPHMFGKRKHAVLCEMTRSDYDKYLESI